MIKLNKITKIYKPSKNVRVVALNNITLKIQNGEFVTILGKSGSGKSTLMYIIGLLEKATRGTTLIDNKDISNLSDKEISRLRNQNIGFIFQQFNLINKLTVLENVLLPTYYSPTPMSKKSVTYAQELLDRFGIGDKKNAFPNQLSGGQQQRVAITRALVNKPNIIIADEPTGNLDTKTGLQIMDLIKEINNKENKTIILVTHDPHIAKYAGRTFLLQDGELINE
jgi:ABC-type lipoprotein export system ATPase subunit